MTVHGHMNMDSATPAYNYTADGLNLIDGTNFTSAGSSIYVSGGIPSFDGGYNTITYRQMLYQYSNYSGTSKSATYNYWGGGTPAIEGTVDYSSYLTTPHANVGPDWTLAKSSSNNNDAIDEDNPLANAWKEYFDHNFTKSKEMAKELFQSKNKEEKSSEILFLWMKSALREGTLENEKDNLLSLNKNSSINESAQYESLRWLSKLAVTDGEIQKAEEYALSIPNTSLKGREILFNISSEIMDKLGNLEKASSILDKVTEKYPDDETLKEKEFVLGLYTGNAKAYQDSSKNIPQTVVKENSSLDLSEAYPNPFNPTTTISYTLPEAGAVQIKVYDILGREVAKLVDEQKSAGKYSVRWNGSNYASGIYFYSVTFGGQRLYKKMLMIK